MRVPSGFVATMLLASSAYAAEYNREVTVGEVLTIAADRPGQPQSKDIVRIYVNTDTWGASTCRGDAADLRAGDKHLLAILLSGLAGDKRIRIGVDDSLRPVDTVCQVVWISVRSSS